MKQNLFDLVAEQEESIVKEAFLPVLRAAGKLALTAAKNPMKTLGAAWTAMDLKDGAKKFSDVTTANRVNPYQPPTTF